MMGFVNPWILLAGVAAGIPVLFHLWKQKRLVPKRWGAFRLLIEVEAKSRRAQVERWLLLALRMAIILLLVLAFATATHAQFAFERKLTASDASSDDHFGLAVGISGNTAVVGARGGNSALVATG